MLLVPMPSAMPRIYIYFFGPTICWLKGEEVGKAPFWVRVKGAKGWDRLHLLRDHIQV